MKIEPGQGGELIPWSSSGLVFKEGNETVEDQITYYDYLNNYIKEKNIPGCSFKSGEDMMEIQDKLTEMITDMISENLFITGGTNVIGDIGESDSIQITMEDPVEPIKPARK